MKAKKGLSEEGLQTFLQKKEILSDMSLPTLLLMSFIYINDLDLGLVSKRSKFADDTKMGINADSDAAVKQLQEDLRKVGEWSKKWQMQNYAHWSQEQK